MCFKILPRFGNGHAMLHILPRFAPTSGHTDHTVWVFLNEQDHKPSSDRDEWIADALCEGRRSTIPKRVGADGWT